MPPKTKKAADAVTSATSPTAGEVSGDAAVDSAALPSDRPAESPNTASNPDTDTAPLDAGDAEVSKTKEVEMVEFFGPGREVTIRRLTVDDWSRLGYSDLEEMDWRKENNWQVPLEDFRGQIPAMREFFQNQPDFRIITVSVPDNG